MYGCESWTIKKPEHQRIDAFELWWWRRLLRVPWTARRSNQSTLKEINPDYSSEGLMLKLQYFGHLMWRTDSLEKTLMLGKSEGRRRRGWQRMRWLYGITDSMGMNLSKLQGMNQWAWIWASSRRWWTTGKPGFQPWGWKQLDMTEWLNNKGSFRCCGQRSKQNHVIPVLIGTAVSKRRSWTKWKICNT